jgi:asparagine synthase (glutamine-hydrolysing)
MCGIAGMFDLHGRRHVPSAALRAMARGLVHRGPDQDGFLERPGLGLASRRLAIVGLDDGRQPLGNEDGSIQVVFNGELFDYPEVRADLVQRGHNFAGTCDTELLPHLWEDQGEGMFAKLRGQFAVALWDERQRTLILARDRFGICPLFFAEHDGWLVFASEIKAILASGLIAARPDVRGIDQLFCFMSVPGPATCFQNVRTLLPGHLLRVRADSPRVEERAYWEADFPDQGHEGRGLDPARMVDNLEALLLQAVRRRLRADVPVSLMFSGGIDSALIAAMIAKVTGKPAAAFSLQMTGQSANESTADTLAARELHLSPETLRCDRQALLAAYPDTIRAAETPVIDTTCAAIFSLSQRIHERGFKVALTGQGADECLAGYFWFKLERLMRRLDVVPKLQLSDWARRLFLRVTAPPFPWSVVREATEIAGGWNAFLDLYSPTFVSRYLFFSRATHEALGGHLQSHDFGLSARRTAWHPLNRGLHYGARTLLSGMLLSAKGDMASMASSVELRHPFLDEDVYDFCAQLPIDAKLHRMTEKYILRQVAARWLPKKLAWRPKTMLFAPSGVLVDPGRPAWVDQLLSPESLRRTGYFDPHAVQSGLAQYLRARRHSYRRIWLVLGLTGVVSTQLWHHIFMGGGLADLPTWSADSVNR